MTLPKTLLVAITLLALTGGAGCSRKEPSVTGAPAAAPPAGVEKTAGKAVEVPKKNEEITIAVVYTSDTHGFILPRRVWAYVGEDRKSPEGYLLELGGAEWLQGYLNIIRQKYQGRTLLLDGGDMFQGTMISNLFEGATVVNAMNHLGYAAAAVGNHEFDFGIVGPGQVEEGKDPFGALKARGVQATFPFLVANLIDRKTGEVVDWSGFAPYAIVQLHGVKVGVVGGPTPSTPGASRSYVDEQLNFLPLADVVKKYAPKMRQEGAGIVIALVHIGGRCKKSDDPDDLSSCDPTEKVFELARALEPGTVDLIIGGHSHGVVAHRVNGTAVVEAGAKGEMFGIARIRYLTGENRVTGVDIERPHGVCHYFFEGEDECLFLDHVPKGGRKPAVFMGKEVKKHTFLPGFMSLEQKQALEQSGRELGPVAVRNLGKMEGEDHPLGMVVNHILREAYPEADAALFNESGLRDPIVAGKITMGDVFRVFPFDNRVALIKLPGEKLLDLLRVATSGAHGLPVLRGLRLVMDLKKDECIAEDFNGDGEKEDWERNLLVSAAEESGAAIDPGKEYVIVTNDFLAQGGSHYGEVFSKLGPDAITYPDPETTIRDMVNEWFRANKVALGGADDRLTASPSGPLVKILNPDHSPGSSCPESAKE